MLVCDSGGAVSRKLRSHSSLHHDDDYAGSGRRHRISEPTSMTTTAEPRSFKTWTDAEDIALLKSVNKGDPSTFERMSKQLGRSLNSVTRRYRRLTSATSDLIERKLSSIEEQERQAAKAKEEKERLRRFKLAKDARLMPAGAQGEACGLYYKRGDKGRVFYYCEGEWLRSSKSANEIRWRLQR